MYRFWGILSFCITIVAPAAAQDASFLSKHNDWIAYTMTESERQVCYASSRPTQSKGDYTDRGDVFAFVTIYEPPPSGDAYYEGGQVSVVAGYRYQEDSTVEARVGDRTFELFTQGDTAWAAAAEDDRSLISAMKAGLDMVVKGTSWRPTETTDTFSLRGFTDAYSAIRDACS